MNKFDLRNTKKIVYNGENIRKIYLGNNLVYVVNFDYPIIYEINNVASFEKYLPKGVEVLENKLIDNKLNVLVSEGNITFKSNSGITKIEKLKHKQFSSCERLFYNCVNLQKIDLTEFNTEDVTTFKDMFAYCNTLNELITKGLNTKKVNDMDHCFYACDFRKLDLRDFNTQNVTDMRSMFGQCIYLEEVNLSSFDTSNVEDFTYMFLECNALKTLDLTKFDTSGVKDKEKVRGMFSGVPETCKIYVGDNWTLTEVETDFSGKFISKQYPIEYTVRDVSNIDNTLPKGVTIIKKKVFGNTVKLEVGEGDISFVGNDNITSIERLEHKQSSELSGVFKDCHNLKTINLTHFIAPNVVNPEEMFKNCTNLLEVDLSKSGIEYFSRYNEMFYNCKSLKCVNLVGISTMIFDGGTDAFINVPSKCEVYISGGWYDSPSEVGFTGEFTIV